MKKRKNKPKKKYEKPVLQKIALEQTATAGEVTPPFTV